MATLISRPSWTLTPDSEQEVTRTPGTPVQFKAPEGRDPHPAGGGGKVTRAQGVRLLSEGPAWEVLSLGLPISCQFPLAELGALTLTLEMNWVSLGCRGAR